VSRVAIVDYGMGNLSSVAKAFEALHAEVVVTSRPADLRAADRLVLPGVGAFAEGMRSLQARGLIEPLTDEVLGRGKPFLGICLGMQLLASEGHEHGRHAGLGWIKATVHPLDVRDSALKQLQIGWNDVVPGTGAALFAVTPGPQSFYFVHGYHLVTEDDAMVAAYSHYGRPFVAAIEHDNVFGVQFHPEKSQEPGLGLLRRFLHWQPTARAAGPRVPPEPCQTALKIRVVPTLLLAGPRMVKTVRFDRRRDVGDPVKAPMVYDAQTADELVYLDIDATPQGRGVEHLVETIGRVTGECFMPLTAGGGIRTVDDIRALLKAGADKVAINSAAVERPDLLGEAAVTFGRQCVVVSIDVRGRGPGEYEVFTGGGRQPTGLDPVEWARRAVAAGAGEVLLTSIDRDGTFEGYDLDLVHRVADVVEVPVIASGGAGTMADLIAAVRDGRASAVGAASMFHFRDLSPIKVKAGLRRAGIPVR
jgi:cyclase